MRYSSDYPMQQRFLPTAVLKSLGVRWLPEDAWGLTSLHVPAPRDHCSRMVARLVAMWHAWFSPFRSYHLHHFVIFFVCFCSLCNFWLFTSQTDPYLFLVSRTLKSCQWWKVLYYIIILSIFGHILITQVLLLWDCDILSTDSRMTNYIM